MANCSKLVGQLLKNDVCLTQCYKLVQKDVVSMIAENMKDFSRSTVVEGQPKETSRSRLSSTLSLPPQSELSNRENVAKHKVNTSVCVCVCCL